MDISFICTRDAADSRDKFKTRDGFASAATGIICTRDRFCSRDTYSRDRFVASAAVSVICPRDTGKCVRACVHAWWWWWRVHACVLRHSLTCCPLHYATSHAMIHSPHARVQLQDHSALAPFPTPPLGPPVGHTFPVCPRKYLVMSEASPACWALVTGPPLVGHPVARAPSHLDLAAYNRSICKRYIRHRSTHRSKAAAAAATPSGFLRAPSRGCGLGMERG